MAPGSPIGRCTSEAPARHSPRRWACASTTCARGRPPASPPTPPVTTPKRDGGSTTTSEPVGSAATTPISCACSRNTPSAGAPRRGRSWARWPTGSSRRSNEREHRRHRMSFEFDPFDPQYWENPYPYYAEMRHEHPVYRREIENHRVWPHYWMISRAGDVNDALADWKTFSSAKGTLVDTDAALLPETIFHMDPPRHDQLRSILARVLTPTRIANLEPVVRAQAQGLVDKFKAKGEADVVTQFARSIPTMTMCTLMNL